MRQAHDHYEAPLGEALSAYCVVYEGFERPEGAARRRRRRHGGGGGGAAAAAGERLNGMTGPSLNARKFCIMPPV